MIKTLTHILGCLFLSLFLFLGACVKAPPRSSSDPARLQHASELRSAFEAKSQSLAGLKAYAQVRVRGGGKTESFDAAILIGTPDKLRVEILDDLGQTRLRLIADGVQVFWEDLNQGTQETLVQDEKALQKTLRLPIRIEDFIQRMLLEFPQGNILGSAANPNLAEERIILDNYEVSLDPKSSQLSEVKKTHGGTAYRVAYAQYAPSRPRAYPQELSWKFSKPKVEIQITLKDFDVATPPSLDKFEIRESAK